MLKTDPAKISSAEFFERSRARLRFEVPPGLIGTWKDFRYSLLVEEDDAYQDLEDNNCG